MGAREGVAAAAAELLKERYASLQIAGTHHGFFDDEAAIVGRIRESGAAVLMVAMGNPLQEFFIERTWLRRVRIFG